jgi:pre-mRNA-splicing factor 38A
LAGQQSITPPSKCHFFSISRSKLLSAHNPQPDANREKPRAQKYQVMRRREIIDADERRFVDERGSTAALTPSGHNPATIMEKPVRDRIIDSFFYKEQCFALNEADVVDRVVEHVRCVGGTEGVAQKPTPFLCLAFKLLQLAPSDAVLAEYLQLGGEHFKYLRALACFHARLTRRAEDVHRLLEPFLEDHRKLKRMGRQGTTLTYMDEFVDDLLVKDRVCGTSLWKMPPRDVLEDLELLEPRSTSDVEAMLEEEGDEDARNGGEESSSEEDAGTDGSDGSA